MSNTNNTMKTQTSNSPHNAIMEAGGKERPPMLAPGNYVQWKSIIKRYIDTKPNHELIHYCLKNPPYEYKFMTPDANATPVTPNEGTSQQPRGDIILTGIDNDIYSTVDACANAIEMWKAIKRSKQGKAIANSPLPTYDPEPEVVTDDDTSSKEKENVQTHDFNHNNVQENLQTYQQQPQNLIKPQELTFNVDEARENVGTQVVQQTRTQSFNCKEFWHVAREFDWRDDSDDEHDNQKLEAHYMYMAQIQEVSSDASDNSGPIFDTEPIQKDGQMIKKERELLASLIEQMKLEIGGSKQLNKSLESSNKALREANTFLQSELMSLEIVDDGFGSLAIWASSIGVFGGVEKFMALGAKDVGICSRIGVVWMEDGGGIVEVGSCRECDQECSCLQDHSQLIDSSLGKGNHHTINKVKIIGERVWVIDMDIFKKTNEKHSIGKSHVGTFGHAYYSVDDVLSKIEGFLNAFLTNFEADFKQQQSEMINKVDEVLKAMTDQIMGVLPSDTVKNPKLNILSARSYPTTDPQCSTSIRGSIKAITLCSREELEYHKYLMSGQIPSLFFRNPIIIGGCLANLKIPCNLGHVHVEKAYIDLNSPLNIMTRMLYNWIRKEKLGPRELRYGRISNFTGRVRGMHIFVGNFTYVSNFMIVEDISSIVDPMLSQVILGRLFMKVSGMTCDLSEGLARFTNGNDEVAYKMPHKIEQYSSLSDLKKEHTKSVYFRNEDDKRRGVDYVMKKILSFYKECLELGPENVTGLDGEGGVT
ncbi:hypothetical protein Tco_1040848 [Tanacetum coccineum]|uniref:MAK10-like protein n=1 Tax=Tanacetum coccineum TaxID=301880 RepID=A0ABQ5GH06_9ASTR